MVTAIETKQVRGTFEETAAYQGKYESLLAVCDAEGTMVAQDRVIERDKDIAPHRFFRNGTREYVFPKQPVTLVKDKSRVIDSSPSYGIRSEEQTFRFDEAAVSGRIEIKYSDSGSYPVLSLTDVHGNSQLPPQVKNTIDNIFSK